MYDTYQTLEEFLQANGLAKKAYLEGPHPEVFHLLFDSKQNEIDKAHQMIDHLKAQLSRLGQEMRHIEERNFTERLTLGQQSKKLTETIQELEKRNIVLESSNAERSFLNNEIEALHKQCEQYSRLQKSMDHALKWERSQINSLTRETEELSQSVDTSHMAVIQMDQEIQHLKSKLADREKQIQEMSEELDDSRSYGRQYKQINNRMTNELFRKNSEIEKLQHIVNKGPSLQ